MSYAQRLGTVDPTSAGLGAAAAARAGAGATAASPQGTNGKLIAPVKKQQTQNQNAQQPAKPAKAQGQQQQASTASKPASTTAATAASTESKTSSATTILPAPTNPLFLEGKALADHLQIPPVKVTHTGVGICKTVHSGDTLTIEGKTRKTFTISNITAPRLGNYREETPDEPFAYAAREYLRKLTVGKRIAFEFEDAENARFANLWVVEEDGTRVDLAAALVSNGYAKVSLPKEYVEAQQAQQQNNKGGKKSNKDAAPTPESTSTLPVLSAEKQALLKLQQEAQAKKLGMWQPAPNGTDPATWGVRRVEQKPNVRDWFQRYRGVPVTGLVERVYEGSTLKIEIPSASSGTFASLLHTVLTVQLCGVSCPRLQMGETKEEPLAKEASEFVKERLLGQTVQVVIYGIDRNDNLYANVTLNKRNIAVRLLEEGLARFVPWTFALLGADDQAALKAAYEKGIAARAGIHAEAPCVVSPAPKAPAYNAVVTYIISPDTYNVRTASGEVRRVSLACVQGAKLRDGVMQPFYIEGREFARQLLFGKNVTVQPEYTISENKSGEARDFVTITLGSKNAAVELVSRGLAVVNNLSREADRPSSYCDLVIAEGQARDRRLGLVAISPNPERKEHKFGGPKAGNQVPAAPAPATPPVTITDFTPPRPQRGHKKDKTALAAKARELNEKLAQLITAKVKGLVPAVIEHVISASAVKLYVPSLQAIFIAHIAGIQPAPRTVEVADESAASATPEAQPEATPEVEVKETDESKESVVTAPTKPPVKVVPNPVGEEALNYVRALVQNDAVVEFILPGEDKSGRRDRPVAKRNDDRILVKLLSGNPKHNIAVGLVKAGLATVLPFQAERAGVRAELSQAEHEAKNKKLGVWANYDEAAARAERARTQSKVKALSGAGVVEVDGVHYMKVIVSEVYSSTEFYVNAIEDKNFTLVREAMEKFDPVDPPATFQPEIGNVLAAKFSADGKWYRAKVENIRNNGYLVRFIDYGNSEKLPIESLRPLARELAQIPSLIRACRLTGLLPPHPSSEHFARGQELLTQMTADVSFNARIDHVDETHSGVLYHVTLMDVTDPNNTVNNAILSLGYARVNRRTNVAAIRAVTETYAEAEEHARNLHQGLYEFGGVDSDDE